MKVYWLDRESIGVAETSDGKNFTSPNEVKTVTIFCTKEDEPFEANDATDTGIGMLESPVLPDEFHEALAYKVIQQGYERKPEQLALAQYFKAQFEEMVAEAKKSANKDFDGSTIRIMGHDY
jgi:hypothetical protein